MMKQQILDSLLPLVDFLDTLDTSDRECMQRLNEKFPVDGEAMKTLASLFEKGIESGELCDREGGENVRYSRVAKVMGTKLFSVDAVRMKGAGPGHTHPQGEFDLCFAVEGSPLFDGNPAGWTVYAPGTWHMPTVEGGTMNILYFLPDGSIEFGPRSS